MKSQLREADKFDCRYTLILGEMELEQETVAVKPMGEGKQQQVPLSEIVNWLLQHTG
jgi:histidyl-tRNA synthetase